VRLLAVNPNTTEAMTATIRASARAVAGPGVHVDAVTSRTGPVSVESHTDEALAVPGLLERIAEGERAGYDGYLVACFGDPGLDAAREVAAGPVLGIAEAAMRTATHLGRTFSVVTTLARTTGRIGELVLRYGLERQCAAVHASDLPVLALEADPDAYRRVRDACAAALVADRSDAVVLGCAGMADLTARLAAELGVPVVDGVAAATTLLAGLVRQGLRTSSAGEYAPPAPKPYRGPMAAFAVGAGGRLVD